MSNANEKTRESKIKIIKGSMEIKIDRRDLIDCKPVGDGIVFLTRPDVEIRITDPEMPNTVKNVIQVHSHQIKPSVDIDMIIDLNNKSQPISFGHI